MHHETQQDIAGWCWQTFGMPEDVGVIVRRTLTEMREMTMAERDGDHRQIMAEAVDVVIILKHLAEYLGYDLEASIAAKMAINRRREWTVHGNGDGSHISSGHPEKNYCIPVASLIHSALRPSSTERTPAHLPDGRTFTP